MWCIYVFFPRLLTAAGEFALYIDVGLSALLVSTDRAMREPQHVERAAVLGSTFFFGRCISFSSSTLHRSGAADAHWFIISLMKRTFYLLALFLLLLPPAASTYGFEVDGIYYQIISESDLTCEVTYGSYYRDPSYSGSVVIPSSVEYGGKSYSVTGIGIEAFYDCSDLTSVELPASLTSIGGSAFSGCTGLASIELPSSLTSIGGSVFEDCTGLTSIELPSSLTSIESNAFSGCSGLTDLHVADGDTTLTLDESVFEDAPLSSVYMGRNFEYSSYGVSPFSGKETIRSLTIGDSVTSIGERAFSGCTSLTDLHIADGNAVLTFGEYVFEDAPLSSVYLGRNFECSRSFSYDDYKVYPFSRKVTIQSLIIGDSVTSIGEYAFYDCTGLTSIEFPASLESIGSSAFSGCSGLTSLEFSASLESIGS